jgi:hypothetical protein
LRGGQLLQQDGINGLSNPNLTGLERDEKAGNELTAAGANNILGEMITAWNPLRLPLDIFLDFR